MATAFQMVRIDEDLIERIDAVKDSDLIPRDPYIRMLLTQRLDQIEAEERTKRARARNRAKAKRR